MLYRILWISIIHQQESAIGTPMSPPSWASLPSPPPSHPSACHRAFSLCFSSLSHTANSHWLSILHIVLKFPCYSLHTAPLLPLLPHPQVCSLCLFLHCSPENKFISAISLDSTYMCQYTVFIFLFLTYFTLYNIL